MTKEEIFDVVRKNIKDVLYKLGEEDIKPEASLKELGANSIDRADITTQTIADLRLKMSLVELGGVANIAEMVNLFYEKLREAH